MICWPVSPRVGNVRNNGGNVNRPRAADDFPMIRARMEELRRERTRPRAADDFRMIRARMEELRRERAQVSAEKRGRSAIHPSPYPSCRE